MAMLLRYGKKIWYFSLLVKPSRRETQGYDIATIPYWTFVVSNEFTEFFEFFEQ